MKRIITNGITDLEPLAGSSEWYWGADYASGDLYEAEELFRSGHPIDKNRLVLVRCPEGTVYEPVRTKSGQYLGRPVYHDGQVVLLQVDFPQEEIHILIFRETDGTTEPLAVLPLSIVEDCYNLMLEASPLILTRSAHDNKFQILWPERRDFAIEDHEIFEFLEGNSLFRPGMRTWTTGRSFWCGIMIPVNCWSGYREISAECRTAGSGSWCEVPMKLGVEETRA